MYSIPMIIDTIDMRLRKKIDERIPMAISPTPIINWPRKGFSRNLLNINQSKRIGTIITPNRIKPNIKISPISITLIL
ncbi:MAG: hypothetical protein EU533_04290 [Promethearchaeota archaeon]|nr:MAG: hypothetical protein EU533_04290 [Candidatus Lokiarchaeota archaeon]